MIFQKKILIKWLIGTGIVLVICFAMAYPALATTIQQTNSDNETSGGGYWAQTLGTGLSGEVNRVSIKTKVQENEVPFNFSVFLNEYNNSNYNNANLINHFYLGGDNSTTTLQTYTFTTSTITLNPDYYYALTFKKGTTTSTIPYDYFEGTTNDLYANGSSCNYGGWQNETINTSYCGTYWTNIEDFYFVLDFAPPNSISIDFPANGTSTPDFNVWGLSGYEVHEPPDYFNCWTHYKVFYNTTTTDLLNSNLYDADRTLGCWSGSFLLDVELSKNNLLQFNTTYYAEALFFTRTFDENYNYTDSSSTYSSIISFYINNGSFIYNQGTTFSMPTSTASSSEWVLSCDPNAGLIANSICNVLLYLFSPKQADLNRFNDLKVAIQNKAPMGYLTQVINILGNFSVSSTPAFALSNASAGLDTYVYNPLKTGLTWLLWIGWSVWLFQRIRNLYFTI